MLVPKVSIAIPAYNAEPFIEDAFDYLRQQSLKDFECIIVDDGSTDNTASVVKRMIKKDSRFRLIQHKQNRGLAASRNTGMKAATAEYIITLDCDDIFDKDLLKDTYLKAKETGADLVVFNYSEYKVRKKSFEAIS